jgi:TnpA family transposase
MTGAPPPRRSSSSWAWCTNWYIRDDTLKAATTRLVNFQYRQPLSRFILRNWDDLLRVAGSLKRGWVTASLLIGKLQSYPRKNRLTRALQEYGRLVKTIFILRYIESEDNETGRESS